MQDGLQSRNKNKRCFITLGKVATSCTIPPGNRPSVPTRHRRSERKHFPFPQVSNLTQLSCMQVFVDRTKSACNEVQLACVCESLNASRIPLRTRHVERPEGRPVPYFLSSLHREADTCPLFIVFVGVKKKKRRRKKKRNLFQFRKYELRLFLLFYFIKPMCARNLIRTPNT